MSAAIPTYPSASATTASTSVAAASAPSAAAPLGIGSAPSSIGSAAGATHVEKCQYPCFAYFSQSDPSLTKALVLASSQSENPDYKALAELLLISLYSKRQIVQDYFCSNLLHMHISSCILCLIDNLSPPHQGELAQYLLANHKQKLTPDMLAFLLCWRPHSRLLRRALTTDKEMAFNVFAALGIDTIGKTVEDSDLAYSLQQLASNEPRPKGRGVYLGGVSTPPKFGSELPVPEGPGFGSLDEDLVDAAFRGYLQSPVYLSNPNDWKTFCDSVWLQFLEKNKFSDLFTKYSVSAAPALAAAAKPPASTLAKK